MDPVSAERCCSGEWYRAMRPYAQHEDLDEQGRVYGTEITKTEVVHGWVRRNVEVKA